MDSTVFKYNHQHLQQHQQKHYNSSSINNIQNNNNQNSIFILNTTTNNILPNNPKLHYGDFYNNNNGESSTPATSSSVWSSASATMCSPAAHAIQKLFNCSSNSLKLNQGNYSGIDSKSFKSKSELLKKKSKFWKYLEGETNNENNNNDHHQHRGIDNMPSKDQVKSHKHKSKYWSKTNEITNHNHNQDLSELLEYSCSLCDNCRCIDCQIAYFDCENSDDSNSEYSFHMNAYEEDDDDEQGMELKIYNDNNNKMDNKHKIHKFNSKQQIISYNEHRQADEHNEYEQCCQLCLPMPVVDDFSTTTRDQ